MRSHSGVEEEEEKVSLAIQSGWIIACYIYDQSNMVLMKN